MRRLIFIMLVSLTTMVGCSPEPDEGSLYHRYADRKGLTVAEVDGFQLGEGTTIDVVMLQAENDSMWEAMKAEFDIRGEEGTVSWLGESENPSARTQWSGAPVLRVIASHSRRSIGIYRIENEAQYDALMDYHLESMRVQWKIEN